MHSLTLDLEGIQDRLARDGYVIVEDVFDPVEDFQQLYREWEEILDEVIDESISKGLMTERYEGLSFEQRFMKLCSATSDFIRRFDIGLSKSGITTETTMYLGSGIFEILTNPRLLDVIETLVGPEIASNPDQHVRLKLPKSIREESNFSSAQVGPTFFHQDGAFLHPDADESGVLTCWIAITDASEELGCLHVYPRTAQEDVLLTHCPDSAPTGLGIPPALMPQEAPIPLPVRAGSIIIFKGSLVHGSFDNLTQDRLRISLDLRFQKAWLPSGRPGFPDFVARSRSHPESELHDPKAWAQLWYDARDRFAENGGTTGGYYRLQEHPDCV